MTTQRPLLCATAGSVDDGKSTLIGRLLLDAKALMTDQLEHLAQASRRRGATETDLSLATDGLRAEREQGITIDVAWRYFATPARRFILADSPGHVQYTRNMVTAASHADVAIIVLDVRRGATEQTRRHLLVARLLGVPAIVVVINKMDLVDFDLSAFAAVRDDVVEYLRTLDLPRDPPELAFVPVSALVGDNVVEPSRRTPWYDGAPLLGLLEGLPDGRDQTATGSRLIVQTVLRGARRGYAGMLAAGALAVGDRVRVTSSGLETTIDAIATLRGPASEAAAGQSIVVHLSDELDVGRGDLLVSAADAAEPVTSFSADLAWVNAAPARVSATYFLKQGAREVRVVLEAVEARYDVTSGLASSSDSDAPAGESPVRLNELCRVRLRTATPIVVDAYRACRTTGSFVLVDPQTAATLAGGMIR